MKKYITMPVLLITYFALMFLPMFPGFLSPVLWFFYPVLSAFLAATPLLWGAKDWKKFGGVAEQGSPAMLMEQDGLFAQMVRLQTEGQNWTIA